MKLLMERLKPPTLAKKSPSKKRKGSSSKSESQPKKKKPSTADAGVSAVEVAAKRKGTDQSEDTQIFDLTLESKDPDPKEPVATGEAAGPSSAKKSPFVELLKDPSSFFNLYDALGCADEEKLIREETFDPKEVDEASAFLYHHHSVNIFLCFLTVLSFYYQNNNRELTMSTSFPLYAGLYLCQGLA